MTPLRKPVTRVSSARDAGREIVVILGPGNLIGFRLFRTRKMYWLTIDGCYKSAVRAEVLAKKKKPKRR